jgi:hypothetical protein
MTEMNLVMNILAAVGVVSAFVGLFAYFSGWTDFGSLVREVSARLGISVFAARPVTYYDSRMRLSTQGSDIIAAFQLPAASVEATFTLASESGKGVLGPSSDPSYNCGFQNAQGTLFGFTAQPATKTGFTYLFFRDTQGQISLIHDVNEKIAAKVPSAWRDFALEFLKD